MTDLLLFFTIAVGINILMFLPAYFFHTDKITDISYAATFMFVALFGLVRSEFAVPSLFLTGVIWLWAIRLGGYLLIRIRKIGRDKRFDDKRNSFWRFLGFWLLQGITVWVVLLPSSLFYLAASPTAPWFGYIGLGVALIGLGIEAVADQQKYNFINNPANKGKWIATGLWQYSRHPNYFGEIMVWVGIYLFTTTVLTGWQLLAGAVSPIYIASLIILVSGIPLLEKAADKRWGDDPTYQEYKKRTSVLMPWPAK